MRNQNMCRSNRAERFPATPKLVLGPNTKLKTLDLITNMTQPRVSADDDVIKATTQQCRWEIEEFRTVIVHWMHIVESI